MFLSSATGLEAVGWPFDISVYLGLVGLFLGHAWLARGRDVPRVRTLYFGLGLLCLWVALETPIDTISDHFLDSVHMVQHVLLGVIAPPLLLLGLNDQMAALIKSGGSKQDIATKLKVDDLDWPFPNGALDGLYDELSPR